MAELVVLNGTRAGAVFVLPEVPTVVGRSPEAHLQVEDPWISSMHAMFERRGAEIWVVDLESRNGTFVGEERVTESQVSPGDVVRFGRTEVRLHEGDSIEALAEPMPPARAPRPPPEPQRATIRGDLTAGHQLPKLRDPEPDQPLALAPRTAAVCRIALFARSNPGTVSMRAALDLATRAALNEGGLATREATGILALFGLPMPAPDDALRALRAARQARDAIRALGVGLDIRAAVDRGRLIAGNVAAPDGFELAAFGETADRTERLLAVAGPGEILAGSGAVGSHGLGPGTMRRIGGEEMAVFPDREPASGS
ncbi:MAG TPA: FHA domain-containing protein [Anaeromyxobacter sp.]|nr:FHA domain-containing protein [Anaeromyxobacter sp.]